jgi:hypothetical protein
MPVGCGERALARQWLVLAEPEVLELPTPQATGIAQALNVDSTKELSFDRCLDERGR